MLSKADEEKRRNMSNYSAKTPITTRIFALCMGAPLVLVGLTMMLGDLLEDVGQISISHDLAAGPHFGLALGPIFAFVGASFLWPLWQASRSDASHMDFHE